MPRKPRQQRSRATVDAIVEAGFICVAELGITGTTTRHIAERAGISVGSLYEYFGDTDAAVSSVLDALQVEKVLDDDARVMEHAATKFHDPENPRVLITLEVCDG